MIELGEVTIWTFAVLACCGYLFLMAALVFTYLRQSGRVRVHETSLSFDGAQRRPVSGPAVPATRPAAVAAPGSLSRYRASAAPAGAAATQRPRVASRTR